MAMERWLTTICSEIEASSLDRRISLRSISGADVGSAWSIDMTDNDTVALPRTRWNWPF